MGYGLIVTVTASALGFRYVLHSEVSASLKTIVASLLLCSFYWRYGLFLQAGVGIAVSLHLTYLASRWNL